jgi:predicted transcriptional regulator
MKGARMPTIKEMQRSAKIKARKDAVRARIMDNSTELGKLIRTRREELRLPQKKVADDIGFSNVFLSRVEFGKCQLPVEHVDKIAKILKLSKQELLFAIRKDANDAIERRIKDGR